MLIDQLINGLVLGNIYVLLAVGMALIFSVANLVNFSSGSVFMIGAYVGWFLMARLGLPLWVALPAAALTCGVLGILIERLALRPLADAPPIAPLLSTIAVAFILDNLALLIFKPETRAFNAALPEWRLSLGGVTIGLLDIVIFVTGIVCISALWLFLYRTRVGWGIRAAAQDRDAALQMGIDVDAVRSLVFAIASGLAGVAGVLLGVYYNSVTPTMGFGAGIKGLTAALLGGLSSVPASLLGGMMLGEIESLATAYLGLNYRNLVAFLVLILILALRPQGLFGGVSLRGYEVNAGAFFNVGRPRRVPGRLVALAAVLAILLPFVPGSDYAVQVLYIGLVYASCPQPQPRGRRRARCPSAGLFAIGIRLRHPDYQGRHLLLDRLAAGRRRRRSAGRHPDLSRAAPERPLLRCRYARPG
ncbi:MAG: branched-chain amino acid ABC transporter permease [Anaerolineae bacterium]